MINVPEAVLSRFGWQRTMVSLEEVSPGFSGAVVCKVTTPAAQFALKRWPMDQPAHMELNEVHRLMMQARHEGLPWVPEVLHTLQGQSTVVHDGYKWDVCSWLAGSPVSRPHDEQIRQAMIALTRLHACWRNHNQRRIGTCPAVQLQHQRLSSWTVNDLEKLHNVLPEQGVFREAWILFQRHRLPALERLAPWLDFQFSLYPCLGDVWSDHLLFTGDQLTGVIDFGGVRYDHPAQDLARLLGSTLQGNAPLRLQALSQYSPYSEELERLTILLDECGVVVSLANWLRWMFLEARLIPEPSRVTCRLEILVNRLSGSNHLFLLHQE